MIQGTPPIPAVLLPNDLFQNAGSQGAEFVGVEHLLRALLSDSECRDVLVASGAKIEKVENALDDHTSEIRDLSAKLVRLFELPPNG